MKKKTLTRSCGGSGVTVVPLSSVVVPDLWHIAQWLANEPDQRSALAAERVLETWHLANDMLVELRKGGL